METNDKYIENTDPSTYAASERYFRRFVDDEEEMDINCLGLSSHS